MTPVLQRVEQLQAALQRNDRAKIVDIARQLVALRAPMGNQWQSLAQIAADNGELTLSREAIDLFVEAAGGSPVARYQKAALLAHSDAWQEAYELLCTLPESVPDRAANAYSRGVALLNLGRAEEGREYLERAISLRPQAGSAWLMLALSVDLAREPALAERIVAAEPGMRHAPAGERAPYYYALGKTHADRGEPARAFAAFELGAREMKSTMPYGRDADRALATQAVTGYDAGRIAAIARQQSEPTARTIFVVGLPRSGTTLVEQILTSHSAVADGGEINRLSLFAMDIGSVTYAALSQYLERVAAPSMARLWSHWLAERFPAPGRVVDKTTNTSRVLGLAAALLPDAPLIWMTRDPLDRAWSCFRTNFLAGAMPWSYDQQDIAFHFQLEDQLLSQWRQILGDRILVVPYEELVTDPAPWIRLILAHCGLPEEPQVFTPHQNRRAVSTSSMMQVRQPINREGIGAAEPYRGFLGPFIEAYYS